MGSVLLVGMEDRDYRESLSAIGAAGHTVSQATTSAFLRIVKEREPDIVLIDISPFRHGAHIVGIMELRRHSAVPIIALCGGSDAEALLNIAAQAGANATLSKPFSTDRLLQAVAQCLAERNAP